MSKHLALAFILMQAATIMAADEPPKSVDPRLKVELFAEHPQIVTPTGLDIDYRGRVFAIESNTHFPPEGYKGHPTDRVLVLSDTDSDGKADKIVVFTDGLVHTMSVLVRPLWSPVPSVENKPAPKQSVYIATRREIRLFHDDNGDDVADRSDPIIKLETKGNYPHNGLAGFALDGLGWLYFGFGENLGEEFKIIGSDHITISGRDGGNIYRCRLDGSQLTRICTGFWNPHANAFDAFGHLFSVDNDPDSRPPCRLIHVIPDGDYGYRFRNGRKGLHPFTSWNGEVPGTLPMVGGTGEAPSGIIAYESDGLPEEYLGNLLVTSWGDHRIDRFRLQPKGTSFTALAEPVITGGENFRPVGLATAPDGSIFFTDWVLRDYKLHGHGRIWRIAPAKPRTTPVIDLATISKLDAKQQIELIDSSRRDVRRMVAKHVTEATPKTPRGQVEMVWAQKSKTASVQEAKSTGSFIDFSETLPNLAAGTPLRPPFAAGSRKSGSDVRAMLAEMLMPDRAPQQGDRDLLLPLLAQEQFAPGGDLVKLATSVDDPFVQSILVSKLAEQFKQDDYATYLTPGSNASVPARLAMLLAARKQNPQEDRLLIIALNDHDPDVRRVAVQWVAEEKLKDLRPRVEAVLSSPGMTADLFLATLAALQMLDGGNPADFDKTPPETYVIPLIKDAQKPASVRAQALRLVSPTDKSLNMPLLAGLAIAEDKTLRLEAVRTLQAATPDVAAVLLRDIAADDKREVIERCEAIVGLAPLAKAEPGSGAARSLLMLLLNSKTPTIRREAVRALRSLAADAEVRGALTAVADTLPSDTDEAAAIELADQIALGFSDAKLETPASIRGLVSKRPKTNAEWLAQLNRGREVDAAAGRRTFFHPLGAGCFKCHRIDGRGGRVGPDLSRAVGTMNRVQLIQSILEPSREISPQYTSWSFVLHDGRVVNGMIVHENEGKTVVGNSEGQTVDLKTADIEERTPQRVSVMPDKLTDRMTLQELRDLIAFLDAQR